MLDRILQRWRIAKVRPYIAEGACVLDVGCADGALFKKLKSAIGEGVGIDPDLDRSVDMDSCKFIAGRFPEDLPELRSFDVITMLAVLEHVPPEQHSRIAMECERLLKPGGYLAITVPSPTVDPILTLLKFIRLVDGMSLEQHYGFDPRQIPSTFSVGTLALVKVEKFQLGLNNLFVFQKIRRGGTASRSRMVDRLSMPQGHTTTRPAARGDTPDSLFRIGVCRTTGIQLLRFGTVGTMNAAVDFGVLNLLMFLTNITSGIYLAFFKGLSFAVAATHSYFWNKYWTFRSDSHSGNAEYVRFMGVTTCGLMINVAITSFIVNAIDPVFNVSAKLWVNLAALVAVAATAVWDFSWYKFVIFRDNLRANEAVPDERADQEEIAKYREA